VSSCLFFALAREDQQFTNRSLRFGVRKTLVQKGSASGTPGRHFRASLWTEKCNRGSTKTDPRVQKSETVLSSENVLDLSSENRSMGANFEGFPNTYAKTTPWRSIFRAQIGNVFRAQIEHGFQSRFAVFLLRGADFSGIGLAACVVPTEAILDTSSSVSEPQTGSDLGPGCQSISRASAVWQRFNYFDMKTRQVGVLLSLAGWAGNEKTEKRCVHAPPPF
jgi:hypothetical protein